MGAGPITHDVIMNVGIDYKERFRGLQVVSTWRSINPELVDIIGLGGFSEYVFEQAKQIERDLYSYAPVMDKVSGWRHVVRDPSRDIVVHRVIGNMTEAEKAAIVPGTVIIYAVAHIVDPIQ